MLDNLYENIGGKIKNWAKWIFIVEAIGAIIFGICILICEIDVLGPDSFVFSGLFVMIFGPIVAWVGSWILYAFGELVEDVHAIRNKEGTTKEVNAKRKAEEKIKREAELKEQQEAAARAKREVEEKAKREAVERAKRESEIREKLLSAKPTVAKSIVPMDKPNDFQNNVDWQNDIAIMPNDEIYTRYVNEEEWSETYRYHCYLELKKRGVQSIQIITNHSEEQNELKILPNGRGYVCPLCGFSNLSFSACAQCTYSPFENISEQTPATDDEYIDITCPKCGELLSFLKGATNGLCPECGAEFEI